MRFGWRARIGQLRPATAIESSEEWRSVTPAGVAFIDGRTMVRTVDEKGLEEMMSQVVDEACKVASARADVIVQCGAPGIFLKGPGYDDEVIRNIHEATGVKATTMMNAMIAAMTALRMTRVAVGSIYIESVNAKLTSYIEMCGFSVTATKALGIIKPEDCIDHEPDTAYRLGREVFAAAPGADGILISCGGLRSFEVIEALERDTGVPVVTSNQAALWQALRMVNVPDRIPNLGRLLRDH
ncbi:MAG: maleate cis-trans isomerase family protein [Candidatus Limnocylindria bacterium]